MYRQPPYEDRATPLPPPGPGRGRLQKKSSRTMAALPSPPSPAPGTLTHAHSRSTTDLGSGYQRDPSPRGVPRTTTWDYASGGGGAYGNGGGQHDRTGASFASRAALGNAPAAATGPVSPDDWALIQEISQIDLGAAGTSRRRYRGY